MGKDKTAKNQYASLNSCRVIKLQSVVALSLQASCKLSTQMQYSKNSKEQNCVDCTERLKKDT